MGLRATFARTAKVAWKALPLSWRAALRQQVDLAKIDYPRRDLYLIVTSPRDVDRAACCAKEPGTVRWIEEEVDGVLYDIGANVGAYSLIAWASSEGRTRVIAFEPGASTFAQLCRNIVINECSDAVTPVNVALSDRSELKRFRYSNIEAGAASHLGLSELSSTSGRNGPDVAFEQQMWAITLDEAIEQFQLPAPQHIKIDVDGHELAVLRGARRTLAGGTVRSLQVEIGEADADGPAIRALLESCGFTAARVSPHPTGAIADYVYVHRGGKKPS